MIEYIQTHSDHLALIILCISVFALSITVFNAGRIVDRLVKDVKELERQLTQTSKDEKDGI